MYQAREYTQCFPLQASERPGQNVMTVGQVYAQSRTPDGQILFACVGEFAIGIPWLKIWLIVASIWLEIRFILPKISFLRGSRKLPWSGRMT